MKKFFSLVLALVMALSLTTAAWGAEEANALAKKLSEAEDGATIQLEALNYGQVSLSSASYAYNYPENLTLVGQEGTAFTGFFVGNEVISGWTFKNITFIGDPNDAKGNTDGMAFSTDATVTGLTIDNCTFVNGAKFAMVNTSNATFTNVTIKNTSFSDITEAKGTAVLLQGVNGFAVTNCTFTNVNYNAIQTNKSTGSVDIEGNTVNSCGNRAFRLTAIAGANLNISNNEIIEGVDDANEAIKVSGTGYAASVKDNALPANSKVVLENIVNDAIEVTINANGKITGGTFFSDVSAYVADGYVVVKDGAFYKVQQAVVAPDGDTATSETTNNVAENVQDAVKDAVGSGETTVTAGETKIEFNDATDMETFANADAEDITTQIVVEDVTETVDAAVADAVEDLVEKQVGEIGDDVVVAAYVEIDIHVFADGEHVGQITELPEKIKVTIPLPAGVTNEAGKKYYVVHEHDGVVELLPATIEGEYLVFYSDTFSTYAVVTQTAPTSAGVALTDKVDMVTTDAAQTKYPNVTVSVHQANAPKDTNKDGRYDVSGNVKYFMMNGQEYVQVNTVSEADYTVYVAGTKTLFGYFKAANPFYYGYGVPFNNFGDKCGQYDDEPVAGTKYYTFETNLYKAVKAGTTEDFNLMVGNELVPVELMSDKFVEHVAASSYDKNYKVVGVKCAECGTPATLYANFASLPKAVQKGVLGVDYFAIGDGQYYVWAAPAVPSTDKLVESAKTADPVALYFGVTALATLGSALLLKKKED